MTRHYEHIVNAVDRKEALTPSAASVLERLASDAGQRLGGIIPVLTAGDAAVPDSGRMTQSYVASATIVAPSVTAQAAFAVIVDDAKRSAEVVLVASPDAIEARQPTPSTLALHHLLGTR